MLALLLLSAWGARAEPKRPQPAPERPAWLGVGIEKRGAGVALNEVVEGSPAFVAGLRVADVILSVDRVRVATPRQLVARVSAHAPGDVVELLVERGDSEFRIRVALDERPTPNQLLYRRLVGKPAPAFELQAIGSRRKLALADLRGQVVLLEFWARVDRGHLVDFQALAGLLRSRADDGLVAVAISRDPTSVLQAYVDREHPAASILRDPEGEVLKRYFVNQLPTLVVIDRDGAVVFATTVESPAPGQSRTDAIASQLADAAIAAERALGRRFGQGETVW